MNRAQRRANGNYGDEGVTVLTITPKQLDTYMPHVNDGDVIGILGKTYRVKVVEEKVEAIH